MYPGHFAAGLALKAAVPRAPTLGLMIGIGLLDFGYGLLVPFGLEGGTFAHIDCTWSHSLVSALLLSGLFAAAYAGHGRAVVAAMAGAVFSHWVLDVASHNPDIDLWPHSAVELGCGPWTGGLGGWLEALVTVAGFALYVRAARRGGGFGGRPVVIGGLLAAMFAAEVVVVRGVA